MASARHMRTAIVALLLAGLALAAPPTRPAYAVAITVDDPGAGGYPGDVLADDGWCTLREAIIAANTNTPSGTLPGECPAGEDANTDVITLVNGAMYSLTINGVDEDAAATGDLDITNNAAATDLQIVVAGGGAVTISQDAAPDDDRVLHILDATVEITGVTITGGDTASSSDFNGGGVYNDNGTLTLAASIVSDNSATSGGGICNYGTLTIQNGSVIGGSGAGNNALNGGGIYNRGTMIVDASAISSNSGSIGGGVYNFGTMTVQSNSTIGGAGTPNTARDVGGGIYNYGTLTINASTVSYNTAIQVGGGDGDGGGIYNMWGTAIINASAISYNTASNDGGGICNVTGGRMTIDASTVSGNSATDGGGIYSDATLNIQNGSTIGGVGTPNTATGDGGGIWNQGRMTVDGSTVSDNTATNGGGVYNGLCWDTSSTTITNSSISTNQATALGGGVYNASTQQTVVSWSFIQDNRAPSAGGIYNVGTITAITNSTLSGNSATIGEGGAIWNHSGSLSSINSCTIANNDATVGGGIHNNAAITTITNSTLSGNSAGASWDGGGIWNDGTISNINYTTITNNNATNGSGIFNDTGGAVTLNNSIVGLPASGSNCDGTGTTTDGGGNLTDTSGCGGLPTTATLNLGPLQNNGGPTETHALLTGSSAINNTGACGLVDQRGYTRDATCDTGAYEAGVGPDLIVTKSGPSSVGPNGNFSWNLTIQNVGNAPATYTDGNIVLNDDLPVAGVYGAPTIAYSAGITGALACTTPTPNMTCTASGVLTIPVGNSITVTVPVTAPGVTGALINPEGGTCEVDPNDIVIESNETNNACAHTVVVAWPSAGGGGGGGASAILDPALSKRGTPENAAPGETVIWTLTVWNPHGETLTNVVVNDPIPSMLDIVAVDTPVGTATVDGQIVTIIVPSLAPGQSFDVTITTVANALAMPGEICNTAYSGQVEAEACITMYPGVLPATGGQPVVAWATFGGAALIGAGVGGYALLRRRQEPAG